MLLLQWGWGSTFFFFFFSILLRKIFRCHLLLPLVLSIDFCYSQLVFLYLIYKKTKKSNKKKKVKYSEQAN